MCEFNVGDHVFLYNSRLRFFAGKLLSKWEGPLRYQGGLSFRCHKNQQLRRHKFEGGERSIKYYISGNPINVETNIIETITPEEYIRDTFQNVPDFEKGIGTWYSK